MKTDLISRTLVALFVATGVLCSCGKSAQEESGVAAKPENAPAALRPDTVTLLFAGDAMTHQAQLDRARELAGGKGYDFSDCFSLIAPTVKAADYAVVNLETPLGGDKAGFTGFPCFSAPDSYAAALQDAGFDLFLTANNHTLDRGDRGLRRTLQVLDSLHVDHIGTYRDASQRSELVPFLREIRGMRIGFLNYTYGTNGLTPRDGAEVSLIDREKMKQEIEATRQAGAQLIVVCVHWGVEYQLAEHPAQRQLAQFLLDQGVEMVIGGHPHVVQPMKVVENDSTGDRRLVVYSLGNFISNMKTNDTRGGAMVVCKIVRGSDGKVRFDSAAYDTFYAAKPAGATANFRVIPSWMAESIPTAQRGWWALFDNSARRVFDRKNKGVPPLTDDFFPRLRP